MIFNCYNLKNINLKKPKKNIQAVARNKRYSLLFEQCRKYKINNILLGHHYDDLIENFLIRFKARKNNKSWFRPY